jgi:hypothetical protein
MATYSKTNLSASTNGKQIKVAATATAGTLIHTAQSGTSGWDELWIYAVNSSAAAVKLTIEWGETTSPDGLVEIYVGPESGYVLVIPGLIIQNALDVRAFAGTANVIMINGYVNRIS